MKIFRKGTYNVLILLVYLFTLQAATGSALFSIYTSVTSGTIYIKEQKPKPIPRHQVVLRKHLNVMTNERSSNFASLTVAPFSLPEIKDFFCLKFSNRLTSLIFSESGKLKDRAPPQFF